MVGNVGLWLAKTLEWTSVTQDFRNGGPLEMLTIANLFLKLSTNLVICKELN